VDMNRVGVRVVNEMKIEEIQIGALYECTDILGLPIKDWHRNEPTPLELKVEYPMLMNGDLFVVLGVNDVIKHEEVYDAKVLTTKGDIGWLFLWKQYKFPANIVEIPKTV
jgi:hypothetical protein